MSTKEKTGSAGRTAGVLFILLALAAPLLDRPWPRAVGAQLAKISLSLIHISEPTRPY